MSRPRPAAWHSAISRAARFGALGLALLSAGCASKPETAPPARMTAPAQVAKVDIEDDGLPAQVAPRYRRAGPDDPSQPWSPNYGGPNYSGPNYSGPNYSGKGEAALVAARPIAEPRRVRYASEAEALAAARSRLAAMAEPPAPAAAKPPAPPAAPTANRLSGVDEDTLVRRAIAEHEMRRRD